MINGSNGNGAMRSRFSSLMTKYDRPGPRYTSYPTAPMFTKSFGPEEFEKALAESNEGKSTADLSLYVHIPFCDTLCYFCGCTTLITRNRERIAEYLVHLKQEIDLLASRIGTDRKVVQMHWGGGTPTYLSPSEITGLASHIFSKFNFDRGAEVSVEIDPRGLTLEHLRALRGAGFNRISMGVQDFDDSVQSAVNRNQGEELTRQAIAWSRELGFSSLNTDLIYGLPLQSTASFAATLEKIIGISPDRIAVYNFAYVPWMKPHQKLIRPSDLPSPEVKLAMLEETIATLTGAGYVYIGMDHFAKADDELAVAQRTRTLHRNFQGYSTKAGCDLFGLGMSAISHFASSYAQNTKNLPAYYRAVETGRFATQSGYAMSADDRLRKHVIMRLMCDLVLSVPDTERNFGIRFDEYFRDALVKLQPLMDDGLIVRRDGDLAVTAEGRLFLRNIALCFDAYYPAVQEQHPVFSRTV